MNIYELSFNVSLVLFSVSLVFTVSILIDRYPKIHRFGHILKTTEVKGSETVKSVVTKKHLNARIVYFCWPTLILLIFLVLVALYFHSTHLNRCDPSVGDYFANSLFPIIYFLLPTLIERITTGLAILTVRDDFNDYECHIEKRQFLTRRFSPETISEIKKSWCYPLYIMLVDSIAKFVLLLMSPIYYSMCRDGWWLTIVGVISYLVLGFASELMCRRQ